MTHLHPTHPLGPQVPAPKRQFWLLSLPMQGLSDLVLKCLPLHTKHILLAGSELWANFKADELRLQPVVHSAQTQLKRQPAESHAEPSPTALSQIGSRASEMR